MTLGRKLKGAYYALEAKDAAAALAGYVAKPALAVAVLAAMLVQTPAFVAVAYAAAAFVAVWAALRLAVVVYDAIIGRLGFSEVELERLRMAL